nr:hypothetical protein [Tanacetum cinerariifolium]
MRGDWALALQSWVLPPEKPAQSFNSNTDQFETGKGTMNKVYQGTITPQAWSMKMRCKVNFRNKNDKDENLAYLQLRAMDITGTETGAFGYSNVWVGSAEIGLKWKVFVC